MYILISRVATKGRLRIVDSQDNEKIQMMQKYLADAKSGK